jgi:hypothetical protein
LTGKSGFPEPYEVAATHPHSITNSYDQRTVHRAKRGWHRHRQEDETMNAFGPARSASSRIQRGVAAIVLIAAANTWSGAQAQNFSIVNGVFGNGGSTGPGTSYQIFSTLGQPIVGKVTNTSYTLESGVGHIVYGIRWTDVRIQIDYESSLPRDFRLDQNYPNPFNPATTIRFALPKQVPVSLTVYNLLGQSVSTLVESTLPPGEYQITLNATNLPTGIYLYRLRAGTFSQSRKLVLLK